jgi:hypothetical protein
VKNFSLPTIRAGTPLNQAFGPMIESHTSGILVLTTDRHHRLVKFPDIENAFVAGKARIDDVKYENAVLVPTSGLHDPATFLETAGIHFGVLNEGYGLAQIISLHEPLANVYLTPPEGVRCTNPANPHYYPPLQRGKAPHQCVVCGYALP